jgi:hypothetical protein
MAEPRIDRRRVAKPRIDRAIQADLVDAEISSANLYN